MELVTSLGGWKSKKAFREYFTKCSLGLNFGIKIVEVLDSLRNYVKGLVNSGGLRAGGLSYKS